MLDEVRLRWEVVFCLDTDSESSLMISSLIIFIAESISYRFSAIEIVIFIKIILKKKKALLINKEIRFV